LRVQLELDTVADIRQLVVKMDQLMALYGHKQEGTVVLCGQLRGDSRGSSGPERPQERWCQNCLLCGEE
jgi:hypothetical protein